jgi:hypothetical protein
MIKKIGNNNKKDNFFYKSKDDDNMGKKFGGTQLDKKK